VGCGKGTHFTPAKKRKGSRKNQMLQLNNPVADNVRPAAYPSKPQPAPEKRFNNPVASNVRPAVHSRVCLQYCYQI